ncbi:glycosyltransferase, partial [Klebsiella pneumoniae]|uniref:glycosyltransferase n=1 Tax=Klebsiella pneumoniae TaxID=573 RepID=UPI00210E9DB6
MDNDTFARRAAQARARRASIRAAYGLADDDRVVLYAGKFTANKRPRDVIEAVAHVPGGVALFVGDGEEREALSARAAAIGVRC